MDLCKLVIFLININYLVKSSKILMMFPSTSFSHFDIGNTLAKGLAEKGHEITMVSLFEDKIPPSRGKYRTVLLNGMKEFIKQGHKDQNIPELEKIGKSHAVFKDYYLHKHMNLLTNFTLKHPNFQKLLNSNETFDLIMLLQFGNDGLKVLSCHYKAPFISIVTMGPNFWINSLVGNPSSYIPDMFLSYTDNMNLWERMMNSLYFLMRHLYRELFIFPQQEEIIKEDFPVCSRNMKNIIHNATLSFVNYHESVNYPVPLVPSMIPIGGLHLKQLKKLPPDLQKFMDEAENGVIYFSLGSNVSPFNIGNKTENIFLKVLGKLKQKVLWKWDNDISVKPDNIKIEKWFPQYEILAHPNVKLFVTHAGLLSNFEAVYHGVPLLCLPSFGDQKLNAAKIEADVYGISIWIENLSEKNLMGALQKLLNDPKYRENVKRRSAYLQDRPIKPLDLAIYWTEFVIKHKGAPHLRVKALDLNWYQYLLLDVIAVLIISIFSMVTALYYFFKKLLIRFTLIKHKTD